LRISAVASKTLGYDHPYWAMKTLAEDRVSRMSTPRNWTREPYERDAVARSGASVRHGSHHAAQTFTTTGVPFSWARSRWKVG
jgi:hypothetical protein